MALVGSADWGGAHGRTEGELAACLQTSCNGQVLLSRNQLFEAKTACWTAQRLRLSGGARGHEPPLDPLLAAATHSRSVYNTHGHRRRIKQQQQQPCRRPRPNCKRLRS